MDVISACAYGVNIDSINNPNHPIVLNAKRVLNIDANLSTFLAVFAPTIAKFFKLEMFDINAINYFDILTNKLVEERKNSNLSQEKSKNL